MSNINQPDALDGNTEHNDSSDTLEVLRRDPASGVLNKLRIPVETLIARATPAAHDTDPAAHLNIVRRTLAANLTLTTADYQHQRIIPDADREVTLPAEASSQWVFLLCHAGASYNITVKRAGGTTVGVLIPGSSLAVAWDGTGFGLC